MSRWSRPAHPQRRIGFLRSVVTGNGHRGVTLILVSESSIGLEWITIKGTRTRPFQFVIELFKRIKLGMPIEKTDRGAPSLVAHRNALPGIVRRVPGFAPAGGKAD